MLLTTAYPRQNDAAETAARGGTAVRATMDAAALDDHGRQEEGYSAANDGGGSTQLWQRLKCDDDVLTMWYRELPTGRGPPIGVRWGAAGGVGPRRDGTRRTR